MNKVRGLGVRFRVTIRFWIDWVITYLYQHITTVLYYYQIDSLHTYYSGYFTFVSVSVVVSLVGRRQIAGNASSVEARSIAVRM